jgi:hypothetical protein
MDTSTNHKLNVNAVAGIAGRVRAAACPQMTGRAEFTDGSLAVRWLR